MKTKTIYECELCGETFEDEQIALVHEECHCKPQEIVYSSYSKLMPEYPSTIEVVMSDGSFAYYKFSKLYTIPASELIEDETGESV